MKKSAVLTALMAMAICGSVSAANPFADVPAGHWAYDSISRLAAAGVIEGYGDDTFRGDRLMTRYEMAQIVAKAMAKGANVDKLAAEFADELDQLGVRVANLEKQSDNVKITGQARYHYADHSFKGDLKGNKGYESKLRSRIWLTGKVNDNWNFVSMLQNQQDFTNDGGDEETKFQRAYLDGKLGAVKVQAGRFHQTLADRNIYDTRMDGIKMSGDAGVVKLGAYFGKPTDQRGVYDGTTYDKAWGVNAKADLGKATELFAGYDEFRDGHLGAIDKDDDKIFHAGLNFKVADNVKFGGMYLHSSNDAPGNLSNKGYVLNLGIGGAKGSKVGSAGFQAKYYNQGVGTFVAHGMEGGPFADAVMFEDQGFKGYSLGVDYTVAKNMVLGVQYYDLKGKEHGGDKVKTTWSQLVVNF